MRDIATTTLSGNLTRDVEPRQLPSGADVARLRIATTTRRRSGEEWVDKTNYFTVEVFGAQARACAQYLAKGSRVLVDAEPDWREWTDQQNNKREAVTFKARQVLFEGARRDPTPDGNGASEPRPCARRGHPTARGRPSVAQTAGSTVRARRPMTCRSDERDDEGRRELHRPRRHGRNRGCAQGTRFRRLARRSSRDGRRYELGSTAALIASRPGSWEAVLVQQLVRGTVGWDDEYVSSYRKQTTSDVE